MPILHQFSAEPHQCEYLPDRLATLEYSFAPQLTPGEYEEYMLKGYRKFGPVLFQPVCGPCQECRPIRLLTDQFMPDRSQRRAMQRNADLRVEVGNPAVDQQRLYRYHQYHTFQSQRKDWPAKRTSAEEYSFSFLQSPVPVVEITVWQGEVLRAVVITEVTPSIVSAVYHYYDPHLKQRSLGTFSLLQVIELAKELEKPWVHFGYYVAGCGSMAYKARFQPCEILVNGVWEPVPGDGRNGRVGE